MSNCNVTLTAREAFLPAGVSVAAVADRGCSGGLLVRRSRTMGDALRRVPIFNVGAAGRPPSVLFVLRRPKGCAAIFGCKG
jgi:hypothetical protein